ncbi:MAG: hypothetical protein K1X87_06465 [Dehalococcoidia bacterium]|nr:hypothetical protein [Dehalococcoidia bacterium]
MPEQRESSDRLEREINEILEKIDRFPTPAERRRRQTSKRFSGATNAISSGAHGVTRELGRASLSQMMLLAFVFILASLFLRSVPFAWPWLLYAGLVLFLTSFVLMIVSGSRGGSGGPGGQQYWRGRPVSYDSGSLGSRMRRWWGRQR